MAGQTTVTVELTEPVRYIRAQGKPAEARAFRFYADDPASAVAKLKASDPSAGTNPTPSAPTRSAAPAVGDRAAAQVPPARCRPGRSPQLVELDAAAGRRTAADVDETAAEDGTFRLEKRLSGEDRRGLTALFWTNRSPTTGYRARRTNWV
ncbi:hypothetical protein [Streptomyces sp. NPDC002205]|uniref:hypothetical protein n=1 Tax=Streptomyces sp. NPDC002205 TaxID=3154411 RepID=UPI00332CCC67